MHGICWFCIGQPNIGCGTARYISVDGVAWRHRVICLDCLAGHIDKSMYAGRWEYDPSAQYYINMLRIMVR